ncbi:MAG TPA: hypothetical protein VE621_01705, partial [Bryobacteraceae bacterium]|nr:hypothetical protein [Bryobacteraceae bacterium]
MEEEQTIPVPETGEESHGPAGEPKPAPPAGEKVEPEEPESDHHEPAAGAATQPVAEPAAEPATDLDAEQLTLREPLDDEFSDATTLAILEAIVYVTDEPLSTQQIASA